MTSHVSHSLNEYVFFMHRLLVCSIRLFSGRKVFTCIPWINLYFMHRLLVSQASFFSRKEITWITWILLFQVSILSQTVVTCITWKSSSFMHRLFMVFRAPFAVTKQSHDSHGNLFSMCTDCVCPQGYLLSHKEVTWIFLSFVHSLLHLSLAFLVELKFFSVLLCSYKDHQEMSSFHQSERGLTWIFNSFMQRLIMCS